MGEKIVLLILARIANEDDICWPAYKHLAFRCSLTKNGVRQIIHTLKQKGFIEVEARTYPEGGCMSNQYRLLLREEETG